MKRSDKAHKIGQILDDLYPTQPIPLDHKDAYTLLVAVMLSAQTTDKKVNEVTPNLFLRADNPEKMSKLEIDEIYEMRQLLETYAIKKFLILDPNSPLWKELKSCLQLHKEIKKTDKKFVEKFQIADKQFHALILKASQNQFIEDSCTLFALMIHFQLRSNDYGRKRCIIGLKDHMDMMNGLLKGNLKKAISTQQSAFLKIRAN